MEETRKVLLHSAGGSRMASPVEGHRSVSERVNLNVAAKLEEAAIGTIEGGVMTKDLVPYADPPPEKVATTEEFLDAITENLDRLL